MLTFNFLKELDRQVVSSAIPVAYEDIEIIKVFVAHLPLDFYAPYVSVKKGIINLQWKTDKNNYVKMSLKGNHDLKYKISLKKKSGKIVKKRKRLLYKKGLYPKTFIKVLSRLNNVKHDLSIFYEEVKDEPHDSIDQTSSLDTASGTY